MVVLDDHVVWARQVAVSQMHTWPYRAWEEGFGAAMVALVEAAGTYRPGGASFRDYAQHRIKGAVIDHARRQLGRHGRPLAIPLDHTRWLPDAGAARALEAAERRVDRAQLVWALEQLEPRVRLMVVWRYWYRMPLWQVGEAWGLTEGRVSQLITEALERLRRLIDPWGLHGG